MNGGEINMPITQKEKSYLRDLAKKQFEYANLPIMEERRKRWYSHNALQGTKPMVVMEMGSFMSSVMPQMVCSSPEARQIEWQLVTNIVNHELIDDDKVIPSCFPINWRVGFCLFDIPIQEQRAEDQEGRKLGYKWEHPFKDLSKDLEKIKPSTFSVDREGTFAAKKIAEEVLGDILPVQLENISLTWGLGLTHQLVELMGMEYMFVSMLDTPEEFHTLISRVCDEKIRYLRWQEEENLLTLNNENHYTGAGSFGFTTELPSGQCKKTGKVRCKDIWANMNSQESIGISPTMYGEFIYPYYNKLASEMGLVYYGCCEPVHDIWLEHLSHLPNLRKVSISAWCNEQIMGERLKNSRIIYSRKPSPNFIGVGNFDENAFKDHISATLKAASGCKLEIIFRDIYTLLGDRTRAGRAVAIVRKLINEMWK